MDGSIRPFLPPCEPERECRCCLAGNRPTNAPCPVARFQNMPSRNVANKGALTNPNTSCSRSMMLLKASPGKPLRWRPRCRRWWSAGPP